ncbi:MAG: hypothetical protein ACOYNN_13215 [Terrimicrobiaceae bacterium]|jgi:hypothetical protein
MPFLIPENKKKSIEKLIAKLEANKEVAKRDINALLSKELKAELIIKWNEQQQLRKVKKPLALNEYEKLHKQALMLVARYENYIISAKAISNVIVDRKLKKEELADKAKFAIRIAQNSLIKLLKKNGALEIWFDREVQLDGIDLGLEYDKLPFAITSRSESKLLDVKERFNWKTIKEVRLEVLNKALILVEDEIDDWYEKNGFVREAMLTTEELKIREDKLKQLLSNLKNRR